jgi:AAA+ ATPase superfamily predicted ATPase
LTSWKCTSLFPGGDRPAELFDRQWEWEALARFATDPRPEATLGIVSGRRRQGKSLLLQLLCENVGGFYYGAIEAAEADARRHLGAHLAAHLRAPAPLALPDWPAAVDSLMALGREGPRVVVLDEFPCLVRAQPALPSIVQAAFAPRSASRLGTRTRLILCGSALSLMDRLLAGDTPLRGRAALDLVVSTLDYRQAAQFWGLDRFPSLAVRVYAVAGGTPAYRRELVADDTPAGPEGFDDWLLRTALNPAVPLFREGRYLLAEEPELRDTALYHSVLAAIAEGRTRRGAIAAALGRESADVGHPLAVLEDAGFIVKRDDVFRPRRPSWHIVEPIIRFYHAILRPAWGQLERPGRAPAVWARARPTFEAAIVGPQFEELCRQWTLRFAGGETLGAAVTAVGAGVVHDPGTRARHQIDVVAFGGGGGGRSVLLLGAAKWGRPMDAPDLARLRRARALLAERAVAEVTHCRLACFSGVGFTPALAAGRAGEVVLVDLECLYRGE